MIGQSVFPFSLPASENFVLGDPNWMLKAVLLVEPFSTCKTHMSTVRAAEALLKVMVLHVPRSWLQKVLPIDHPSSILCCT